MKGLKAVLFDAGNTIVHVNHEAIRRICFERGHACDPKRLAAAELRARRELDTPALIDRTNDASRWFHYYGAILDGVGIPRTLLDDLRAYHDRRNLWDVIPAEVPPALDRLRERYRLGVVSNANGTVADVFARLGVADRFEVIVDSGIEGIEKPDPRIFHIALDRMKLEPHEAVYVGDIYHVDVIGARRAGMEGILLDPGDLQSDKDCRRIRSLAELP